MGGGDLNMKKHFHPLTMENLERVWKAEEKKRVEEERITQLQSELAAERQKEVFEQQAIETGLKKKTKEKLDWMYQGEQCVNSEAYLLGRRIDKHTDVGKEEEKGLSSGVVVPSKVNTSLPKANDVLAKIKEDPLFLIKKKEEENRKDLMANPIKLRRMKELIKQQAIASKHERKLNKKSKKKKHRHSSSSESSGDEEIQTKYTSRHESPSSHGRYQSPPSSRRQQSPSSSRRHQSPSSSSRRHESPQSSRHQKRDHSNDEYNECDRNGKRMKSSNDFREYKEKPDNDRLETHNKREYNQQQRVPAHNHRDSTHNHRDSDRYEAQKKQYNNRNDGRRRKNSSSSSSGEDDELEAKRNEMMSNAKWRESQRTRNVKHHQIQKEAEEKDFHSRLKKSNVNDEKAYFVQKMQKESFTTKNASVEDRIHRNIHSKQRTNAALDRKFTNR